MVKVAVAGALQVMGVTLLALWVVRVDLVEAGVVAH
jgi:hypothetical protein